MQNFLKFVIINLLIFLSISSNLFSSTKITGERWYDWNDSTWVQRQFDDYVYDTQGLIADFVQYIYDYEGNYIYSEDWECSYSDSTYFISRYNDIYAYTPKRPLFSSS